MTLLIYPDVIFVINYPMNVLLLEILGRMMKQRYSHTRVSFASVFGAVMACIMAICYQIPFAIRFLCFYIVVAIIMIRIAFGKMNRKELMKRVILLYGITYVVGGGLNSLFYNTRFGITVLQYLKGACIGKVSIWFLLLGLGIILPVVQVCYLCISYLIRYHQEFYEVKLYYNEKTATIKALLDTGNELYDPLYQKPVLVMEFHEMETLLTKQVYGQLQEEIAACKEDGVMSMPSLSLREMLPGLHVVPFTSVGKANGKLVALIIDKVLIRGEKEEVEREKVVVALSDDKLSVENRYQMILHKDLLS